MSVRTRAAMAGAILALGVAPAAAAAHPSKHHHKGKIEAEKTSKQLRKEITSQRMFKHAQALQMIADENGGNRASGCEAGDFTGFTAGHIALMQRGSCPFAQKVTNAQAAGAVGAIIFNSGTPGTRA
jgi:hypothetical protein